MKKSVEQGNNVKEKRINIVQVMLICCAVFLILVYLGGIFYFKSHYLPATTINGITCGGSSVDAIQEAIIEEANTYVLQISGRDGLSDNISANEIVLQPVFDDGLQSIMEGQQIISWPVTFLTKPQYEISTVVEYDEAAFNQKINGLVFCQTKNQRQPVDAYISEVSDDGFQIIPEDQGSTVVFNKLKEVVSNAVLTLSDTLDLDEEGCYVGVNIASDNQTLMTECESLNRLVKTVVTYTFGDDVIQTTPAMIADWLSFDDEGHISLVTEKVREFVNDMARSYDTFGKTRKFVTHTGENIDITQGSYGWWMNRAQETDELIAMIQSGESGERTPVYYGTAAQYGSNDWGNTYVEIDLTAQHLYLYVDGANVLESDFVSGNVARSFETPRGIYGITYKEKDATLKGQGYNSPVSYWMPFNNNVGMHDATWRKSFGGNIYLTNGSHGCINLPKDAAEKIFEQVEKNTPVIVYGGATAPKKEEPVTDGETPADGTTPQTSVDQGAVTDEQLTGEAPVDVTTPDTQVPEGAVQNQDTTVTQ